MLSIHLTFFIYGLTVMFYILCAWIFWVKNTQPAFRLIAILLAYLIVENFKNIIFIYPGFDIGSPGWCLMNSFDIIGLPLYATVFLSLCRPQWINVRFILLNVAPFVAFTVAVALTGNLILFLVNLGVAVVYAIVLSTIGFFCIRDYNHALRQQFSYMENINLSWLKYILLAFLAIYILWAIDVIDMSVDHRNICLIGNLLCWFAITYFLYRHESVLGALIPSAEEEEESAPAAMHHGEDATELCGYDSCNCDPHTDDLLACRIHQLFHEERIYLNPRLKLSDVAAAAGSNRTYISQFFNRDSSFFEYVNQLRVEYACRLLTSTRLPLGDIAQQSGFNSLATFHRVFSKLKGVSPARYRAQP